MVSAGNIVSKHQKVSKVTINISGSDNNRFVEETQLLDDIESHLGYPLSGGKLIHKDLSRIEKRLKNNKFVYSAQVVSDHKGRVLIDVQQECPVARIITKDSSYYLTQTGKLMPMSHNYSSRVTVILGNKINEILRSDSLSDKARRKEFLDFMNYIYNNHFLKAQVETIEVLENEKIVIYPQITHQKIHFGKCEDYVDKFEKVRLFYSQILPRKGWAAYSSVNVEYKNQIICE